MESIEVMRPLYPPEGAPVLGYACRVKKEDGERCGKVTKTQRGMWSHLRKKHNITKQPAFNFKFEQSVGERTPLFEEGKRNA